MLTGHAILIHAGALGDFIMSLRVVATLRQSGYPHVSVLGRPTIAQLAIPGGGVDTVHDIEVGGFYALLSEEGGIPPRQAHVFKDAALVVSMLGGPGGPLPERLRQAGAARVISVDPRPRSGWQGHVSDQWLKDLETTGLDMRVGPPSIDLSGAEREAGRRYLQAVLGQADERTAVLHPGSGGETKRWPLEHFIELAERLREDGWKTCALLGPVEADLFSARQRTMVARIGPVIAGEPLSRIAGILSQTSLFVGNDSGVSHLAAAVGTASVAVFGTTDPVLWRPMGPRAAAVGGIGPGWPTVEDVLTRMAALLSTRPESAGHAGETDAMTGGPYARA